MRHYIAYRPLKDARRMAAVLPDAEFDYGSARLMAALQACRTA
ncbi:hypothetical protein ACFV0T_33955 [Streptomyces sp. NPDC059582]